MGRDAASPPEGPLVAVVLLLAGIFAVSQGLSYPLLALVLERQGVSPGLIGLNTAMTPLGLILSAPLVPLAARRLGAGTLALAGAFGVAALLALLAAFQDLWLWFALRFALGIAINGLYVTSETFINALARPASRGRLLGLYASALAAGLALGPFALAVTGSQGWPPFLVGIVLAALAGLLLVPWRRRLDRLLGEIEAGAMRRFLPLAPLLLFVVAVAAGFDQAVLALLPVYGLHLGEAETAMALAVGVLVVGNVMLQPPIGWLADLWSPARLQVALALATAVGAALLPLAFGRAWLLWPLLFVWGSLAYGVYTVALVELGTRFRGTLLLAGNAAFGLMWGLGGMFGPAAAGAAMDAVGPQGLPLVLGLAYLALAGVYLARRAPG